MLWRIYEFGEYWRKERSTFPIGEMKLHLHIDLKTVWYFEGEKHHGNICLLTHREDLQSWFASY
jgi:hypothetical protein